MKQNMCVFCVYGTDILNSLMNVCLKWCQKDIVGKMV